MNDYEKIRELALEKFDVGKWKHTCNCKNCQNKPNREFFIHNFSIKAKKGLVTLYLCKDHHKEARELLRSIKELKPRMYVEMDVNLMGR